MIVKFSSVVSTLKWASVMERYWEGEYVPAYIHNVSICLNHNYKPITLRFRVA